MYAVFPSGAIAITWGRRRELDNDENQRLVRIVRLDGVGGDLAQMVLLSLSQRLRVGAMSELDLAEIPYPDGTVRGRQLAGPAARDAAQPCLSKACHGRTGDLEQSRYVESPGCRAAQIL
jgi:hypothetical protein